MKKFLLSLLMLSAVFTYSQNNINKWQKAIINIECHEQFSESIWEQISNKSITYEEAILKNPVNFYSGTAIFLKNDSSYYLITARHVVLDTSLYSSLERKEHSVLNLHKSTFYKILLIPSVDNWNEYFKNPPMLMNMAAGGGGPFLFSDSFDLAVINLDYPGKGPRFVKRLLELGYVPVNTNDIDFDDKLKVGDDILCLGFPSSMSRILNFINIKEIPRQNMLDYATLPVASFGKVAQYHKIQNRFLGDVSIYPGNSGGPVIFKNKLVGIISAQPTISVESLNSLFTKSISVRIPFGYFEKVGPLKEMIRIVQERRNAFTKAYPFIK